MAITLVNPDGLPQVEVYRQVAIGAGAKLVFVAGQVARDGDGNRIGEGDLAAQAEQAYLNVGTALAAAGATLGDLAKLTIYVVDWRLDLMPVLMEGVNRAFARLGGSSLAPVTLIGVAALAEPDLLIEIEATAVVE
ncbi:RidA family protein [Actinosynnema mirum]|uniref:Endoribonuclease L-PSP n=1 Tax=Actinosynnema mirum (strain ATCC 29888 / DSM 43827 / JCM 3225 / NBRC 14064 / NCIMB 13271 / NRRL B-12336 / IMRU 3971 / 101) TaxID=446462 RepID=C6WF35_ACTMD|nr:RidA family protein [Actinosynnema mirum]ACU34167.1 Endoribonuclease L-PSP [Actinosynnema mirum DSM 43827]